MESWGMLLGGLCAAAGICEQLLGESRYFGVVRLTLGLYVASALIQGLEALLCALG